MILVVSLELESKILLANMKFFFVASWPQLASTVLGDIVYSYS